MGKDDRLSTQGKLNEDRRWGDGAVYLLARLSVSVCLLARLSVSVWICLGPSACLTSGPFVCAVCLLACLSASVCLLVRLSVLYVLWPDCLCLYVFWPNCLCCTSYGPTVCACMSFGPSVCAVRLMCQLSVPSVCLMA